MSLRLLLALSASLVLAACQRSEDINPPAEGFDLAGSDPRAIDIADSTMAAMGGRKAWDNTHFITWRFFGGRLHVWDKFNNNERFEDGDLVVVMNLDSEQGRAWRSGKEITDADDLKKMLDRTKGAWINDSYWLLMPHKLKDSGVTLTLAGEQNDANGAPCDVLQLTFAGVGRTPDNKYHVLVDRQTHLVSEWTIWFDAAKDEPRSLGPWTDWQRCGDILIAAGHGKRSHTDIAVFDDLPSAVFTTPKPFELSAYQP